MNYSNTLLPIISASEYDSVAEDFLSCYCPKALSSPMAVPILEIAKNDMQLDVKFVQLSEDLEIFGLTVFDDGFVEIYDTETQLYDEVFYRKKTVLIDPVAYKRTNTGCVNNTIAHECVHWYKHRLYYKRRKLVDPRYARFCKCSVNELHCGNKEESILEQQAIGIAPRILMPKDTFCEMALSLGVKYGQNNSWAIERLHDFFQVSKESVQIRLHECSII